MALKDLIDAYSGFPIDPAEIEAAKLLKELGVEFTAIEIVNLLKDEKRAKEVMKKLKMKAFW